MPHSRTSVYAFVDFRKFLAEYMEERGKQDRTFTHAYVCRRLGLPNSRSFLGDVIRGAKPLTPAKTQSLIEIMELPGEEARFFRTLVLYNQSALPSEKEFYLEQLVSMNRSASSVLDRMAYGYYRTWYHSTIRALLDVIDVKEDLRPLAQKIVPKVSLGRIKASLRLMEKYELIRRDGDGCWRPAEKSIHSGDYVQDEIIKAYQVECLEIAKAAVLAPNAFKRNISTETLGISGPCYLAIEARLQKFKSEVRALVQKDDARPDRVYQLNIQLFPQSN